MTKTADLIEQRRIGEKVARALGLPLTSYSVLETIGSRVLETMQENGRMIIVVKNHES